MFLVSFLQKFHSRLDLKLHISFIRGVEKKKQSTTQMDDHQAKLNRAKQIKKLAIITFRDDEWLRVSRYQLWFVRQYYELKLKANKHEQIYID